MRMYNDLTVQQKLPFKAILEASPNVLIVINEFGRIVYTNKSSEQLFGYKKEELKRQPIELLIPRLTKNCSFQYFNFFVKKSMNTTKETNYKTYALKKDETKFLAEININTINDTNFYVLSIVDITTKKRVEQFYHRYEKKIQRKNEELEQFAYVAAHNLQEPLKSISGLVDILTTDYLNQFDEEAKHSFEFLNQSAQHLKNMITALLKHNQLGQNSKLKIINCQKTIATILDNIDLKNIKFEIDTMPYILGYEKEIQILFKQLINNAIKFRKKQGVTIIKITSKRLKNNWLFSIEDNGIGIETKYAKKIFTIFQKLHNRDQYAGLGTGLSFCKKIVELHHGDIWVQSSPNKGTKFYFTLSNQLKIYHL